MVSKYAVLRYVPDPITDERVNIGVIAFDGAKILCRFTTEWERVRRFAERDISNLRNIVRAIEGDVKGVAEVKSFASKERYLHRLFGTGNSPWDACIQISESRASLADVDTVLQQMSERFLAFSAPSHREYRDKRAATKVISESIRDALLERREAEDADRLMKVAHTIDGKRQRHSFDLVVANGNPFFAAQGISFELPEAKRLKEHLDALAWSIADVKASDRSFPIGVMALPPRPGQPGKKNASRLFEETARIYADLGADFLTERSAQDWAINVVEKLPQR